MAEGVGFEPTVGCPTSVFKTDAIDHSATLPRFVVWGVGIRVDAMDQEKIDLFFVTKVSQCQLAQQNSNGKNGIITASYHWNRTTRHQNAKQIAIHLLLIPEEF